MDGLTKEGKMLVIREEEPEDIDTIRRMTQAAFATAAHSSHTESQIIDALRSAGALAVSLVAVEKGEIVGHVAFSPVKIDGQDCGWYGLGPVSVRPDRQNAGIGSALIREGLARLSGNGAGGCVVLGDPHYYRRFGFENDTSLRFEEAPAEYFMRLTWKTPTPAGRVAYHEGFAAM